MILQKYKANVISNLIFIILDYFYKLCNIDRLINDYDFQITLPSSHYHRFITFCIHNVKNDSKTMLIQIIYELGTLKF